MPASPGELTLLRRRPRGKGHAVGGHQPGDAAEVQFDAVLGSLGGHPSWVQLTTSGQLCDLVKELLKTGGRDELEDPCRRVTRVPEGVPLALRLEDQVADLPINNLPSEVGAD